jgi:hypothetical protein
MKKVLLAGVLAGALALPAGASATTLSGDCSLAGTATFTQPLTGLIAGNGFVFDGKGTCTGTLDGKAITDREGLAKVVNDGAYLSCAASGSMGGDGTLTFVNGKLDSTVQPTDPPDPPDQVLKFTLDQLGVATEVPFRIQGKNAGLALGEASFRDSAGAATAQDCVGNGVKSLGFTADVRGFQALDG